MTIAPEKVPAFVPAEWTGPDTERAYRTLDKIIADPASWHQKHWFRLTPCGTTGCFAGLTCLLNGDTLTWGNACDPREGCSCGEYRLTTPEGRSVDASYRARDLLRINRDQADVLFDCGNTLDDLTRVVLDIFGKREA